MERPPKRRRRPEAIVFERVLRVAAAVARSPAGLLASGALCVLAAVVRVYRRASPEPLRGEALGREWQRMMPSPKLVPITTVEGDTVYGEIHAPCPLRGTGDVRACHRLMAYDRALMRPAGARFVVLESQAEPGVTRCRVAIHPAHVSREDLVPAHVRAGARGTSTASAHPGARAGSSNA